MDSVASTLGSVAYAFTVWDNMQLWPIPTIVYGPMVNSYSISVNCTQPYMLNTIKDFESQLAAVPGVFDLYLRTASLPPCLPPSSLRRRAATMTTLACLTPPAQQADPGVGPC